jgi:hemoglobin
LTIYEQVGGEPFFVDLVERFYQGVEGDPVLRPLYPQDDMEGAKRRLHLFLMQYFGGPATYNQERGHPRLRMRHMGFTVGEAERDAWMTHMRAALAASEVVGPIQAAMLDYFENTATFLRNK